MQVCVERTKSYLDSDRGQLLVMGSGVTFISSLFFLVSLKVSRLSVNYFYN